ncbi:MAG: hypothetical protein RLO52_44755 [Sandaracinaceae bacterium]
MRGMVPATSLSTLCGDTLPPDDLQRRFARRGWRPVFWALSRIASWICNDGGRESQKLQQLRRALIDELSRGTRLERAFSQQVSSSAAFPPAHESAIYFLQSLALMYGSSDDHAVMSDGELAFLLIAANDYVFGWREADERELARTERLVAECGRTMLYNRRRDPVAGFVRGASILEMLPRRTPRWQTDAAWTALQQRAFGTSLAEYVESFSGPLVITSEGWESDALHDGTRGPVLDTQAWTELCPLPEENVQAYWDSLITNRDDARDLLLEAAIGHDGLPIGATVFFRTPFVRFDERRAVPASPWVVRDHLRFGLWNLMRVAAAEEEGRRHSKDWTPAFGDLVEQWCQRIAKLASESPRFVGQVIADHPDADEIEDVVVVQNRRVALFSVKGGVVREDLLRGAGCRSRVVDFYDRFFFAERTKKYRGGAVRLLEEKVTKIRSGAYEPRVDRHARIYTVIVTYDDLGTDTPGGYDYLQRRANSLGLLQAARVAPVVSMPVDSFETLLGYCAKGGRLFDVLRQKGTGRWATGSLENLLHEISGSSRHQLPQVDAEFEARTHRSQDRLVAELQRQRDAGEEE